MYPADRPSLPSNGEGDSSRVGRWRERLRTASADATRDLASVEVELTSTRAVRANGGDDDEHDPDGIPLSAVLQDLEGQKERALAAVRAARHALQAVDEGGYGICRICRQPIPAARLEIRPTTTTCVHCADSRR